MVITPADELAERSAQDRSDGTDGHGPGDRGEEAQKHHGAFEPVDGVVVVARLEHVEGFAKGEVAHDVKGPVVEPGGHVDRTAGEGGELVQELVGVG